MRFYAQLHEKSRKRCLWKEPDLSRAGNAFRSNPTSQCVIKLNVDSDNDFDLLFARVRQNFPPELLSPSEFIKFFDENNFKITEYSGWRT